MALSAFGTQLRAGDATGDTAKTIDTAPTGAVRASNVVTILTTTVHNLAVGDIVDIAGVTDTSFNGRFYVFNIVDTDEFQYRQAGGDTTSGAGTSTKVESTTAVAELKSIPYPNLQRPVVEATNHDSADQYFEGIAGIARAEAMTVTGNFTGAASQDALRTDLDNGTKREFAVVWPGAIGHWIFEAFVESLEEDAPHEGIIGFSATLRTTGKPTFNPGQ